MTHSLTDTEADNSRDLAGRERHVFEHLKDQAAEHVDSETIACLARIQCRLEEVDERERRAYAAGYVDALSGVEPGRVPLPSSSAVSAVTQNHVANRRPKRKVKP